MTQTPEMKIPQDAEYQRLHPLFFGLLTQFQTVYNLGSVVGERSEYVEYGVRGMAQFFAMLAPEESKDLIGAFANWAKGVLPPQDIFDMNQYVIHARETATSWVEIEQNEDGVQSFSIVSSNTGDRIAAEITPIHICLLIAPPDAKAGESVDMMRLFIDGNMVKESPINMYRDVPVLDALKHVAQMRTQVKAMFEK